MLGLRRRSHRQLEYLKGRDALWQRIKSWRETSPGHRALLATNIEHHHNVFRFRGVVLKPDGTEHSQALDIGELDRDGLSKRIITFHLREGAPPGHWPQALVLRESSSPEPIKSPGGF